MSTADSVDDRVPSWNGEMDTYDDFKAEVNLVQLGTEDDNLERLARGVILNSESEHYSV